MATNRPLYWNRLEGRLLYLVLLVYAVLLGYAVTTASILLFEVLGIAQRSYILTAPLDSPKQKDCPVDPGQWWKDIFVIPFINRAL